VIPVLEVGGTHVSAALVDPSTWSVHGATRLPVDSDAPAADLLDRFAAAASALGPQPGSTWGVAMPDPFDYEHGIGNFAGVAKFASLDGVDVGAGLRTRIGGAVVFLNDADAFVLGEWTDGAVRGVARCAGITLGTGVGSGWLVDGVPTDPGVPAGGRIHTLTVDGRPLEDVVSRRAVRRAYAAAGGDPALDVREIAAAARAGETRAHGVLAAAFTALGRAAAPALAGFGADGLVVGGSMTGSWDLLGPLFEAGLRAGAGVLRRGSLPPVAVSADSDRAPLIGAAVQALRAA